MIAEKESPGFIRGENVNMPVVCAHMIQSAPSRCGATRIQRYF